MSEKNLSCCWIMVQVRAMISISLCAPILGMAQGAYDEFVGATRERVTRGAALSQPVPMAELPSIQHRVGEAASCIDAARLLVDRDCRDIMATINGGGFLTEMQRARNKGDLGFAAQLSLQAVDRIFEASGGGGSIVSYQLPPTYTNHWSPKETLVTKIRFDNQNCDQTAF